MGAGRWFLAALALPVCLPTGPLYVTGKKFARDAQG